MKRRSNRAAICSWSRLELLAASIACHTTGNGPTVPILERDSWLHTTSLLVCVLGFKNSNVQKEAGKKLHLCQQFTLSFFFFIYSVEHALSVFDIPWNVMSFVLPVLDFVKEGSSAPISFQSILQTVHVFIWLRQPIQPSPPGMGERLRLYLNACNQLETSDQGSSLTKWGHSQLVLGR